MVRHANQLARNDVEFQKNLRAEYVKLAETGGLENHAGGIRGARADMLGDYQER